MDKCRERRTKQSQARQPGKKLFPVVLASLLLSACSLMPQEEQLLAPPLIEPAKIKYEVAEAVRGTIVNSVKGSASFQSLSEQDLSFKDPDTPLKSIKVRAGDKVKRGDVLAELELGDIELDIKVAELEVRKARLQLNELQTKQNNRYLIEAAKLDVVKAEMNHKVSETKLSAIELEKAKLRVKELEENPDKAYLIEKAKIELAEKEIEVEFLRQKRENSRLLAPFDGEIVFVSNQSVGEKLEANQPLITIVDPGRLTLIHTASDEKDLAGVTPGMQAVIKLDGATIEGRVVQTPTNIPDNLPESVRKLYQRSLLIEPKQMPAAVSRGKSVSIEVVLQRKENALIIPRSALREFSGRTFVHLLDGTTKREVDVETGIVTPTEVEIVKGLKEKDRVILK
jgi:multidrug efflux pump subunit AcrA (membrane-fusion protein)